ncbi:hypothetical protein, partial [Enterococcus hirae]
KVRKTEKISSILTINIKIELIFFLRKNYCPTLFINYLCDLRRTKTTTLAQTKRTKPIILISTLLDSFVFGKNLGVLNVTV